MRAKEFLPIITSKGFSKEAHFKIFHAGKQDEETTDRVVEILRKYETEEEVLKAIEEME